MPNLSSLMSMAAQDPNVQQSGIQALMSGKVKPEEVQKVMEHPAFSSMISTGSPDGQAAAPNAFAASVAGTPPVVPGMKKQTKSETKTADTTKDTVTHNNYLTADQFAQNAQGPENLPEVQDERNAIKNSELRLAMQRSSMPENDGGWLRPLTAYIDSTQGTKLSEAAKALPTNAERLSGINSSQDALTKRKNDLAKLIMDGTKQMKDGTTSNQMSSLQQQINTLTQGDNMNSAANARLAALPIRAGQDFDKQLTTAGKSVESFNRGDRILNDEKIPLTEQGLNMVQQDISNGLTASGQATDSKVAMDMQSSIQGIIQAAKTKYTDYKPGDDLRKKIPGIVEQVNKVLHAARQEYQDNINRQADQISKTYEGSYGAIPNLKETVEAKRQAISDRFPKSEGYSKTGSFKAPAGPIKVTNPKTGESHLIAPGPKQQQDLADAAIDGFQAVK